MKTGLFLLAIIFCCFTNAPAPVKFKSLYQLVGGSWQMKTKKGVLAERWKKVGNNELQSQAFQITGKDTTMLESVRLVQNAAGIYYLPTVKNENGGKPVSFKLVSWDNGTYIFSNPEHDFPQRVAYQFVSRDSIHAWIDGRYKGKFAKQDFYYKRVK